MISLSNKDYSRGIGQKILSIFFLNFIPNNKICFFDFILDGINEGSNISNTRNKHIASIKSKFATNKGNNRFVGVNIGYCFSKFSIKQISERNNFVVETTRTTKSIFSNFCERKVCRVITGDTSECNKERISPHNFTSNGECSIREISGIFPAISTNSNRPVPENTDNGGGISWYYHYYKNNQNIEQVRIKRVDRSGADILFSDGTFIIDADTVCIDVFVRGIWYHLIGPNIYDLPEF